MESVAMWRFVALVIVFGIYCISFWYHDTQIKFKFGFFSFHFYTANFCSCILVWVCCHLVNVWFLQVFTCFFNRSRLQLHQSKQFLLNIFKTWKEYVKISENDKFFFTLLLINVHKKSTETCYFNTRQLSDNIHV